MRVAKLFLVVLASAVLAAGIATTSYAFHSGGVAECEGCHSMHTPAPGGVFLLVGTDQSSACLTCHQHAGDTGPSSYHISTAPADMATNPPLQRTPGGDFGWLKKTYTWLEDGAVETEKDGHGHNIIAVDFGYGVDPSNPTAPGGGSFPAAQLACNSCHDPHGKYRRNSAGNISTNGSAIWASGSYTGTGSEPLTTGESVGVYRLLAGAGYSKDGITFSGVPAAKVASSYNKSETLTQTRVAYGVNTGGTGHVSWSSWCSTCHPDMHTTGGNYTHPVDHELGSTIKTNYDQYVKSGDMTGGNATAYLSLTPFASNVGTYALLSGLAGNAATSAGPGTTDQVQCLSCHRAHASGFDHMLRWYYNYEFLTKNGEYVGIDNPVIASSSRGPIQSRNKTIADFKAAYYDRPATVFASYQRQLCNKCHAQD